MIAHTKQTNKKKPPPEKYRNSMKYRCPCCSHTFTDITDLECYSSGVESDSDSDFFVEECIICFRRNCEYVFTYCDSEAKFGICCVCKYDHTLIYKELFMDDICDICKKIFSKKFGRCVLCFSNCIVLSVFDYKCCNCRNWSKETQCKYCIPNL